MAASEDTVVVPTAVEPGYKTTEFWLALATSLISVLVLFNVIHVTSPQTQGVLGLVGLVAPNIIYILSRGIRKIGQ